MHAKEFDDGKLKTVMGQMIDVEVKVEHYCPKHHLLENINCSTLTTRWSNCNSYCKMVKTTIRFKGMFGVQQRFYLDEYYEYYVILVL